MSMEQLKTKLNAKRPRVLTRYKYYEMKSLALDFQISTPPQLQWFSSALGWCGKAVDSMADRLRFVGFDDADRFNLNEIFDLNNRDIMFDSAILSALIASCSFAYIYIGNEGYPKIQIIDGGDATGSIDPTTGLLREGYAILDKDEYGQPTLEAYFEPGRVTYIQGGAMWRATYSGCPYCTLVPIIHRPDDKRPFGHSRISRACMSLQDSALRTMKRSEIAAEFYSVPQKYVTGLSPDAELMDKWKATMASMLSFDKDEDGDHPVLGQFQAASQSPHLEQLRMFAALFGGETGLTLDDLGFATANPSSADAIKAGHENLRMAAKKAQRCFGSAFINIGMVAACLRDNMDYSRSAFYRVRPTWEPVFDQDGSALSGIGDALIKISQAFPDYLTDDKLKELIGV